MGGPDVGPHEHGDALPALREVHPEPDAQGRWAFPGGIAGGGMGIGEACAAAGVNYGSITANVIKKGVTEMTRNPLIYLVAGPGFEPGTFGL